MPETREQYRARETWATLTERFGEPTAWPTDADAKPYLNALRQSAARIHISGLGQALVFLKTRNKDAPKRAAEDLASLVLAVMGVGIQNNAPADTLVNCIRNGDLLTLMRATEESLAMISWLCRYLQGAGVVAEDEP